MKNLLKSVLFVMLVSSIVFFSCSKEESKENKIDNKNSEVFEPTYNVEVQNGMLVFENKFEFDVIKMKINKSNREAVDLWEEKIGIKTPASIFNAVMKAESEINKYYESLPEDEQEYWRNQPQVHSDVYKEALTSKIIKLVPDGEGGEYFDLNYYDNSATNVINEEGLVKIGNKIYQYTENAIKIIRDGDFSKVDKLKKINKTYEEEDIIVTVYDEERLNSSKSVNGHNWTQTKDWIVTEWGGWRNKKAKKRVRVWIDGHSESYGSAISDDCTRFLNCTFTLRAEAQKKNFWGNWVYDGSYWPTVSYDAAWSYEYRDYSYDQYITSGCGLYDGPKNYVSSYSCTANPDYLCPTSPHTYTMAGNNSYHSLTPHGVWESSPKYFSDAFTVHGTLTAVYDGKTFIFNW